MDYEATEKGVLAKVIVENNESLPIGKNVAVVVKKKDNVGAFSNFSDEPSQSAPAVSAPEPTQ